MYRIGMRNIKTAIAVFLSVALYFSVIGVLLLCKVNLKESVEIATKTYTPFFACLAAAYSVSTDKNTSVYQAKLRIIASIIGGLFGVFVVFVYTVLFKQDWGFTHITAHGVLENIKGPEAFENFAFSFIIPVVLIGVSTTLVIWLCNILKQKSCCFVAVLTLTAVMSSFGTAPILYGFNRILSTLIGILIALAVNLFRLPRHRNKNQLFVISLDSILIEDDPADTYDCYMVGNMTYNGADVTYYSSKTVSTIFPKMTGLPTEKPFICMSGAAAFDPVNLKYLYVENMEIDTSVRLYRFFQNEGLSPFVTLIYDDLMYTYNENPTNEGELLYAKNRKNHPYGCFINERYPHTKDVCYFILVNKTEVVNEIREKLLKESYADDLTILNFKCKEKDGSAQINGYSYLKIYSSKIKNLKALDIINEHNKKVIVAGCHEHDDYLMNKADYSVTSEGAPKSIQDIASKVAKGQTDHNIFKELGKVYHMKKLPNEK